MSIDFYVYINEPNDKAFIHHAECSFCNFGKGLVAEGHSNNGKWIGPFNEHDARKQAKASGKKHVRWCGHCANRLGIPADNV